MCSIAGVIGCGDRNILARMSSVMRHRGPDESGAVWFDEHSAGFAHNRLSIIDLTPGGSQPMASADGRHWIVFNGEIYNYRELRRELEARGRVFLSMSDTEVLLAGLIEWDEHCLNKLDGMFAFAWMDRMTGRVFAARDHLGLKPLYYAEASGGLIFASEIKALLQCPFLKVERDEAAIRNPSRFMLSPDTGFAGIKKLAPAHCLTYDNGRLATRPYWRIEPTERLVDEQMANASIGALVERAVEMQMISDRPIGTFLSGGLDSSLVSALMRKHHGGQIDAFTIKFSSKDQKFEQTSKDSVYARKVADHFGFKLHEFEIEPNVSELLPLMVWHMDEPLSDPAAINTYLISKTARDMGIVVLLNGVGGDEVFGGYRKHLACLKAGTYQAVSPAWLRRGIRRMAGGLPVATSKRGLVGMRMLKRFLSYADLPEAERYLASDLSLNATQFNRLYNGADYFHSAFWTQQRERLQDTSLSYLTRMCLNDTLTFLPEHNLTYSDKAAMAASIETRAPLVSKDVVSAMFQASPDLRIRNGVQKYLLKTIGEKQLPRDVVYRPKASFGSPLRSWIRGPLRGLVDDLLSERQVRDRGLYDPRIVNRMIAEDRSGREDHSMWIWNMLTVEIWHRTFLDGSPAGPIAL
jgi:asparagine synthase (glutamine-hydrolysing)